jgi:zinc and cadmium transporter
MSAGFLAFLALIATASLAGGLFPLTSGWSNRSLLMPVSFSGGVLLGAVFFEMIPESAQLLQGGIGASLLAGFLMIFVLEHFALVHPHPEGAAAHGQAHHIHLGVTAYAGLSFHALLDGLALSSTYSRPEVGGVVLLAIIFHKIPTAFALTSLLILDRWSRSAIVGWMSLFAFSTPVGAVITWIILRQANNIVLGNAVALSAGTFLAVATSDVLPQIRRFNDGQSVAQRAWPLVALMAGISVTWVGRLMAG